MPKKPDRRFDIDALFKHMIENLGHDLDQPMEWHFSLRSKKSELSKLATLGELLSKDFDVQLEEEVETWIGNKQTAGPPMLTVVQTAALKPAEVKKFAAKFESIAKKHGFTYDGVSCYEPTDFEELFGWLDLEEAVWRLRHYTDTGLAEGDPTPFMFALAARKPAALDAVAEAARRWRGVKSKRTDEDGPMLQILCPGKNDEAALRQRYKQVADIAKATKVKLLGVQFFEKFDDGGEGEPASGKA